MPRDGAVSYSTYLVKPVTDLTSIQRQARELVSAPRPAARTRLLSCKRRQSRVVTGLALLLD